MVEDLIIAVAVVVAGGGAAGLTSFVRSRRKSLPPGGQGNSGGGVGTLERGDDAAGTGTLAPPEPAAPTAPPDVIAPPDIAEVPGVVVERPPPSAGRLARLRSRLARSQSAMGSVLLNLISSGKLDEQAWEDIEDTLISADMGVGPARELVEEAEDHRRQGRRHAGPGRGQGAAASRADRHDQPRHGPDPAPGQAWRQAVGGTHGRRKTARARPPACGKLGPGVLVGDGKTVVLGAADTFWAPRPPTSFPETWGRPGGCATTCPLDKARAP